MPRWRVLVAGGIIVGLAAVLVANLLADPEPIVIAVSSTTSTAATSSTTATSTTTTTVVETTSTTSAEERLEEVRGIVQELWFGWFDAIYRKDTEALWEVVATTQGYENGIKAFERITFTSPPSIEAIAILELETLLDRSDCLVVYISTDLSRFRGPDSSKAQIVSVLWPQTDGTWRFASQWANKVDLWQNDCDIRERETTP